MADHEYVGTELEVFALASNWKAYFGKVLRPFIQGDVLEVGAGLGGTTAALWHEDVTSWTCLEPDPSLASKLRALRSGPSKQTPEVIVGTLAELNQPRAFDSIVYIDVLEHIEDDRAEMARAAARLTAGGSLIVLAPAFNVLYSPFDRAIGHYRRYTKRSLRELAPAGSSIRELTYLDSLGAALSLTNRVVLQQKMPTRSQVLFWDRNIIPVSRVIDRWFGRWWGRSVVAVYAI